VLGLGGGSVAQPTGEVTRTEEVRVRVGDDDGVNRRSRGRGYRAALDGVGGHNHHSLHSLINLGVENSLIRVRVTSVRYRDSFDRSQNKRSSVRTSGFRRKFVVLFILATMHNTCKTRYPEARRLNRILPQGD